MDFDVTSPLRGPDGALDARRQTVVSFLTAPTARRFAFGANSFAESLSRSVRLDGIIDDFSKRASLAGLPILRSEEIGHDDIVVNCVVGVRPKSAELVIRNRTDKTVSYFEVLVLSKVLGFTGLKDVLEFSHHASSYSSNSDAMQRTYELLSDAESKSSFNKMVSFYRTGNLEFLEGFKVDETGQYFDPVVPTSDENGIFVDVGAFDGETSLNYVKRVPDYSKVIVIEPEPGNMQVTKQNLECLRDVEFIEVCASDTNDTTQFQTGETASRIEAGGNLIVSTRRLDDVVDHAVTMIKLDIEGSEVAALRGAENLIRQHHPVIAVCCYHRADDYWKLPEVILTIRSDYKVYFRHYTEGSTETVMYFVPETEEGVQ